LSKDKRAEGEKPRAIYEPDASFYELTERLAEQGIITCPFRMIGYGNPQIKAEETAAVVTANIRCVRSCGIYDKIYECCSLSLEGKQRAAEDDNK